MTDAVSEFAPKRLIDRDREVVAKYRDLDEIEDTIAQHRRATDQSTATLASVQARDALTDLALIMAALPLRIAMEMADAVVTLQDYKPPATKIELAMHLNEWAEKRLAAVYGAREG
jgi:hypothetical protein